MFGKRNKTHNVSKDKATIPRHTGKGAKFQCLQWKHNNSNVLKAKIRTPVFRGIRAKIPTFGIIRARIPMFWRIRAEFQCLKDKVRILMFATIRSELQSLER